jgi:signal transduction histidine kinase
MHIFGLNIDIALIFFVYGLAFFCMGLAILLESIRSSLLAEAWVLLPLAMFGLIHGSHEWLEMMLLKETAFGVVFTPIIPWMRLGLLVFSFSCLIAFGIQALRAQRLLKIDAVYIGVGLIAVYVFIVLLTIFTHQGSTTHIIKHADTWARYALAVPGAFLAAIAMVYQSQTPLAANRPKLALSWKWAAFGFAVYGLTQAVVSPLDMFPAKFINTEIFLSTVGLPIQVIRAAMALLITFSLIRATQNVEEERRNRLEKAHLARVEALERMQQELQKREEMRRELLSHIVIAQEDERARIAIELHDETAQTLSAFSLNLATLKNACPDFQEANDLIEQLQARCHEMSQGIYRIMHDLRPSQLDNLGLVPAIQQLADEGKEHLGLEVVVNVSGRKRRLDSVVATAVYRIVQEALTNVSRHANTNSASVNLHFHIDYFEIQVCDSGIGFDARMDLSPPRGWGLAGMRERSEAVGGNFYLDTSPGKGTIIKVSIPENNNQIKERSSKPEISSTHQDEEILYVDNTPDVSR